MFWICIIIMVISLAVMVGDRSSNVYDGFAKLVFCLLGFSIAFWIWLFTINVWVGVIFTGCVLICALWAELHEKTKRDSPHRNLPKISKPRKQILFKNKTEKEEYYKNLKD